MKINPEYHERFPNDYELPEWEHPSDYGGFSPDGDFLLYARDRDSLPRYESNYHSFMKLMEEEAEKFPEPEDDGEYDQGGSWVYDFRANHWGVGWVEYLLLRRDAPDELQRLAYETLAALEYYPVLDEENLNDLEYEEAEGCWNFMSDRDKAQYLCRHGISIFAMRRDFSEIATADLIADLNQP